MKENHYLASMALGLFGATFITYPIGYQEHILSPKFWVVVSSYIVALVLPVLFPRPLTRLPLFIVFSVKATFPLLIGLLLGLFKKRMLIIVAMMLSALYPLVGLTLNLFGYPDKSLSELPMWRRTAYWAFLTIWWASCGVYAAVLVSHALGKKGKGIAANF